MLISVAALNNMDGKRALAAAGALTVVGAGVWGLYNWLSSDDSTTTRARQEANSSYRVTGGGTRYVPPANTIEELCTQIRKHKAKFIPRHQIVTGGKLGEGQFGTVMRGRWETTDVAVKTLKHSHNAVKFFQEAAIMAQFNHQNVLALYGIVHEGEPKMMVLELMPGGDLKNHLRARSSRLSEAQLMLFSQHVCEGMVYLAGMGYIHRDLAARNILLSADYICKIADFGLSREVVGGDYYYSQGRVFPIRWTAPEANRSNKFSSASDVWSYGCLLYEIWSLGRTPFENIRNDKVLEEIEAGTRPPIPRDCPRTVSRIMRSCWSISPSQRPKFSEILQKLS